jgi:hypothetical protein
VQIQAVFEISSMAQALCSSLIVLYPKCCLHTQSEIFYEQAASVAEAGKEK